MPGSWQRFIQQCFTGIQAQHLSTLTIPENSPLAKLPAIVPPSRPGTPLAQHSQGTVAGTRQPAKAGRPLPSRRDSQAFREAEPGDVPAT